MTARSRYDDEEQPRIAPADGDGADGELEEYEDAEYFEEEENYDEPGDFEADLEDATMPSPTVVEPARPAARSAAPAAAPPARAPQRKSAQAARGAQSRPAASSRTGVSRPAGRSSRISRPVEQPRARRSGVILPLVISGVMLAALIAVLLIFRSGSTPAAVVPRGEVVATVNGVAIYEREFEERAERDKQAMLRDPLTSALLNNFEGITGTRGLQVVRYDALDKLINLEVIRQEARKEGIWPTDEQQVQLIVKAKESDLKGGESFEAFLSRHRISEEQYNNSVVTNVVYAVMAGRHMPGQGAPEERTNEFIQWICSTRKSYDIKIMLDFQNVSNQPCTSGLPLDIPIAEIPIPGAEPTAAGGEIATPTLPDAEATEGAGIEGP